MFLDDRVELFEDVKSVDPVRELLDEFLRQRVHTAEFEVGDLLTQRLFGVLVSDAGGDDADLLIVPFDGGNGVYRIDRFGSAAETAQGSCCGRPPCQPMSSILSATILKWVRFWPSFS